MGPAAAGLDFYLAQDLAYALRNGRGRRGGVARSRRAGFTGVMRETAQGLVTLMDRVAAGDPVAFDDLYRATSGKLYGTILRIVRSRSSADEILQEVYVRVWQRAGDFDPRKASPITWMATIARNRSIDEIRRKRPEDDGIDGAAEVAADVLDPLNDRDRSESLQALIACLKALPDDRREIILLAYCRGMSREALAQRFGKPVPTIKTWLFRGLAQLKTCLSP